MNDTIRITHVTLCFFLFITYFFTLKLANEQIYKREDKKMKEKGKRLLILGGMCIVAFILWTMLILKVDVQPAGVNGTNIGFSTINLWFHKLTGANMMLYTITDWLGLVPIFICMIFAGIGCIQLIQRKSLFKVDYDIFVLGIYYVVVILGYLLFEMIPINYRPILIEGVQEVSYPSSTTLLVLSVMPTLSEQVNRRLKSASLKRIVNVFVVVFSAFMVLGRVISGVHWITDIVASVMLSTGLFCIYRANVLLWCKED